MRAEAGAGPVAAAAAEGRPSARAAVTLDCLSRSARTDAPVVALCALGMVGVALLGAGSLPPAAIAGWCVAVAAMLVLRHRVVGAAHAASAADGARRVRDAQRLVLTTAAAIGSAAAASPWLPDAERMLLTLLLAVVAAFTAVGSTGALYGGPGALLLGPMALAWLLVPAPGLSVAMRVGVAATLCACLVLVRRRDAGRDAARDEIEALRAAHASMSARHDEVLGRLRSAEDVAGRTLAAIGHRLRQPLYALRLFAASLGEQPLAPRAADLARRLDASGQALAHDLDTLLDLSRLQSGLLRPEREPVEVELVVGRVTAALEIDAAGRGLSLGHELEHGLRADTDRRLFERVLRTLVVAALERGTPGGGVTIEARHEAGRCVIEVIDGGRVPDADELARLLSATTPADPSGDPSPAVAVRLVALLGGSLGVHAEPDAGTCVRLELPPAAAVSPAAPGRDAVLAGLHVLVVDDDPAVRAATRFVLEDRGCRVSLAADATEAMGAALADRPDLALLDLQLGRGDSGLQLAARLRERWGGLAVVMIAGERPRDALDAAAAAGWPVLGKPIDVERLVRTLQQASRSTATPPAETAPTPGAAGRG
jgi:signal transduction histidine kinase/ActR/RegA family two-component response regulator